MASGTFMIQEETSMFELSEFWSILLLLSSLNGFVLKAALPTTLLSVHICHCHSWRVPSEMLCPQGQDSLHWNWIPPTSAQACQRFKNSCEKSLLCVSCQLFKWLKERHQLYWCGLFLFLLFLLLSPSLPSSHTLSSSLLLFLQNQ